MTRVFYASTLFGAMSLAAGIDAGQFGERRARRILIVSTNTNVPEITDRLDESPGFDALRPRFDEIVQWNDFIAPMHPSGWAPPAAEIPMLSRLLRDHLALADPVTELVVESVAVPPARTIGTLIGECPVAVYSDGLMSYGPTRDPLPADIGRRVARLHHLDLVPSVPPLLLREIEVTAQPIPDAAFVKILAELPSPTVEDAAGCPVILGQYLSALGILEVGEEDALHVDMLRALARRGHKHVVFRPHPAAGRAHVRPLRAAAQALGVRLTTVDDNLPVETWFGAARPELVVSCFSTALATAGRYFGIPAATMGTELVLERIAPYQNSNRIPATIVDATVSRLTSDGTLVDPPALDVNQLVQAVGYCMQSERHPDLRDAAVSYLQANGPTRYFKKRRLERVGLVPTPLPRSVAVLGVRHAQRASAIARKSIAQRRHSSSPAAAARRL